MDLVEVEFIGHKIKVVKELYDLHTSGSGVSIRMCMPNKLPELEQRLLDKREQLLKEMATLDKPLAILAKLKEEYPELWL